MGFDPRLPLLFRREGEKYNSAWLCSSLKSKCVNIIVRDCVSWNRLGPLIVCESWVIGYVEILSEGLLSIVDDLLGVMYEYSIHVRQPGDITFMQDGAPCHKPPNTRRLLE
jgi:hypothetical protein